MTITRRSQLAVGHSTPSTNLGRVSVGLRAFDNLPVALLYVNMQVVADPAVLRDYAASVLEAADWLDSQKPKP